MIAYVHSFNYTLFFCVQTNHFLCIKKVNLEATVVIILSAAVFAGPW